MHVCTHVYTTRIPMCTFMFRCMYTNIVTTAVAVDASIDNAVAVDDMSGTAIAATIDFQHP